ncbi:MAG TPA: outer membrane cobalamin receptor protein, partial [Desulfotignum sp.]|nr:outer membrane cobalamin receptor protein [Desulfotignum sp.]
PNSQTVYGVELELTHSFTDRLNLEGNLTLLNNSGASEVYFYNDFSFTDADGNLVKHFQELEHDYDLGPDILANLKGTWQMTDHLKLVSELRYFSGQKMYFPIADVTKSCDDAWTMDLHLHVKKFWPFDLSLFVTNVFDNDNAVPGVYSVTQPVPRAAGFSLNFTW